MVALNSPWIRSVDGIVFGVCKGLADRFQLDVMLVRILWVLFICFGGSGIFIYLVLAVSLPLANQVPESRDGRLFGVCARAARRFQLDVGLVRAVALTSVFFSAGVSIFVYIALYFILPTF
jgi:phage shock protein C